MFVYLIGSKDGVYCKIGMAKNPSSRIYSLDSPQLPFEPVVLAQYEVDIPPEWHSIPKQIEGLQPGWFIESNPKPVYKTQAHLVEKALHKKFSSKKIRGEWFLGVTPTEFLKAVKKIHKETAQ